MPKRGEPSGELLPIAADGLQVNTCRNTACAAFGLPPVPRTEETAAGLPKRRGRPGQLVTHTFTGREDRRGLSCRQCGHISSLKSNLGVQEELARARGYLEAPSLLQCANGDCDSRRTGEPSFQKFGKTKSGSPRVRCRTCGRTQSMPVAPTWRQKAADKNEILLSLLVNKVPMRRILEVAGVGPQTLYRKIEFFEQQCLAFAAAHESRLRSMEFGHVDLATDRQDYLVNWGSHLNRLSFMVRAVATAERRSGFVLGIHPNFDPGIGAVEVEHMARLNGDVAREPYARQRPRFWLLSDYARTANRREENAARSGAEVQDQRTRARSFDSADPFDEHFVQTAPSRGVQIRQEYVLMAHFLLLEEFFRGARRITLFMDQDAGLRTAALVGFNERIRRGELEAFHVRSEKELTVDQRDQSLARSERALQQFMTKHPGLSRTDAAVLWLKEVITGVLKDGKNPTPWAQHPLCDRAEPGKCISLLTVRAQNDPALLAKAALTAGLKPIDRFFMSIRRRISLLERPISTPSNAQRTCHIYAPYNPAVACQLLNIFRVIYNYHLGGAQDKSTPAMRLGLLDRRISLAEIIGTPRRTSGG